MAHGRKTGGRQKGSLNKATLARQAAVAEAIAELTPEQIGGCRLKIRCCGVCPPGGSARTKRRPPSSPTPAGASAPVTVARSGQLALPAASRATRRYEVVVVEPHGTADPSRRTRRAALSFVGEFQQHAPVARHLPALQGRLGERRGQGRGEFSPKCPARRWRLLWRPVAAPVALRQHGRHHPHSYQHHR